MRILCGRCQKSVSSEVSDKTVVRAWVECPECLNDQEDLKEKVKKLEIRNGQHRMDYAKLLSDCEDMTILYRNTLKDLSKEICNLTKISDRDKLRLMGLIDDALEWKKWAKRKQVSMDEGKLQE
jgi:hypothetical protein